MSLFKQFETDPKLEKEGILLDYGPNKDLPAGPDGQHPTTYIKIARAGGANAAFMKRNEVLAKKHRRAIQTDTIELEQLREMSKQTFIDTVLLGWENVTDKAGTLLPFSKENALKLFTQLPDLYEDITEQATKASLFRIAVREVDAKN